MSRPPSPNADQWRNRAWQCQSRLFIADWPVHADIAWHNCQLPREHYEPHHCWCGVLFTADGTQYSQQRLPLDSA